MNLTVLTGSEAMRLMGSEAIHSKWMALYERCPWATACQHPDFVLPWYQLYQGSFLPIVVLEESDDGALQGLLTLARRSGATTLTGAGERQAEYQAWLGAPEAGDDFIRKAIPAVRCAFPGADICLRYLPANIPLGWMSERSDYGRYCTLRSHRRPVMNIDRAAMAVQRAKKNHRQNFNRLQRMGEVKFEKVCGHERFARVFDDICTQYDFRQGALHHQLPFAADALKKRFYLELDKRGLLHTAILTVGGDIAASHVGLLSSGRALHLGINTHAPAYGAHSPGNLLLAMLGVHLAEEDVPVFDLTPGGDEYKEHFATEHDLAFELTIHGNVSQRLKTGFLAGGIQLAKTGLRTAGIRPSNVLAAIDRVRSLGKSSERDFASRLHRESQEYRVVYRLRPKIDSPGDPPVSKNCLADVMKYDPGASPASYWQFLRLVMQRMTRSNQLYSLVRDGKLLVFCWLAVGSASVFPPELQMLAAQSSAPMLLFDLYVHPELATAECVQGFIKRVLYDLQSQGCEGQVFCHWSMSTELRDLFESSGFTDTPWQPPQSSGSFQHARLWESGS